MFFICVFALHAGHSPRIPDERRMAIHIEHVGAARHVVEVAGAVRAAWSPNLNPTSLEARSAPLPIRRDC